MRRHRHEIGKIIDHCVGPERRDRLVGEAKGDGDDRNPGGARGGDVDAGVADIYRRHRVAACPRDRGEQRRGIGLANGERVTADDRGEPSGPAERGDQRRRQCNGLISTDRKAHPGNSQCVHCRLGTGIWTRTVDDMRCIVFDEDRQHLLDLSLSASARHRQPALDQRARPMPD